MAKAEQKSGSVGDEDAAREAFLEEILGYSPQELAEQWPAAAKRDESPKLELPEVRDKQYTRDELQRLVLEAERKAKQKKAEQLASRRTPFEEGLVVIGGMLRLTAVTVLSLGLALIARKSPTITIDLRGL